MDIQAEDSGTASICPYKIHQDADSCGLACTIWAQKAEEFSLIDLKVNTVYAAMLALVELAKLFYLDDRCS